MLILKILKKKNNKVIAIDRDKEVCLFAKEIKKKYDNRFQFYNIKFSEINTIKLKSNDLKGIIFDLGYSNNQIKDLNRGFSFRSTGRLNMMMGINDFSCDEVISNMSEENLNKVFKYFGEEKFSKRIARKIVDISNTFLKPIGFGVLTCDNLKQAVVRSDVRKKNKGKEVAQGIISILKNK